MCGISGFNFKSEELIRSMTCSLNHRGPDATSFHVQEDLSIGHNRLSIIDLSQAGSQPMFYRAKEREVCIVFNGEIYNYIEIKAKLGGLGYVFSTHTDTEVIMASYIEWGEECVNEFNGMWSFCLYDLAKGLLFCSRDRLGVKPFYYYYKDQQFIFSSELKAILKHESLSINRANNINKVAVELFFSLGYIPAPHTIYNNVCKLSAGCNLVFNLNTSSISFINAYYQVAPKRDSTNKEALLEEGKEILKDAVKLRMRSDVPVGAFLSGGLDSSAVVGEMRHFTQLENLHTFSIGFEDKLYDESNYINLVKDYFGTIHHHHIYSESDFSSTWNSYSDIFDEPFGDYSSFPSFKVCNMASDHVRVVLSGDGGDEIFGGYPVYNTGYILDKSRAIPEGIRNLLYRATSGLKKSNNRLTKVNETLRLSLLPKNEFHSGLFSDKRYKPQLYRDWSIENLGNALELCENNLSEALRVYDLLHNTLPDNYLVKVDRTSMANSIEVRSPFLDYRFVEYAQRIPAKLKVGFRQNKILMRELIKDIVPKEILTRNKMGFTPPINIWLYNAINEEQFKLYCSYLEDFSAELFSFYQQVLQNNKGGYMRDFYMVKLAIFGKWFERWIDGSNVLNLKEPHHPSVAYNPTSL